MRCIYCKNVNTNKNRSHALHEAIFRNEFLLPNGVECDRCNKEYSILAQSIITHPEISKRIQLMGLPGKKGIRKELGNYELDDSGRITIKGIDTFKIEFNNMQEPEQTSVIASVKLKPPPDFKDEIFSRALNYLAVNLLAHERYDLVFNKKYSGFIDYVVGNYNNTRKYYYKFEGQVTANVNFKDSVYSDNEEYFYLNILGAEFCIKYVDFNDSLDYANLYET